MPLKNTSPLPKLPTRRHILGAVGLLAGLGLSGLAGTPQARAEAFGRIYHIEARLQPTVLVAGKAPQQPVKLVIEVNPSDRRGQKEIKVSQGSQGWQIDGYKMRVFLKAGPGGGSDNGTLNYLITADVGHNLGDRFKSIYARSHGALQLQNGNGQIPLSGNKYFTGTLSVKLIAPDAGW
ncbi:hypothetical protein E3E11_03825 [Oecophyllibacter saccharovorans]|uniref:hypothetical protein n=1 Tax=Oecophyllibacter saccharovorans TaxID=2558360 RepID=UPI001144F9F7|nr:hypothetical protein [Oecophyllibacter saccharovorans]QDH15130.1 hypothetical protein E3E11_03825 [Oecophyllibacter saccharovorans]